MLRPIRRGFEASFLAPLFRRSADPNAENAKSDRAAVGPPRTAAPNQAGRVKTGAVTSQHRYPAPFKRQPPGRTEPEKPIRAGLGSGFQVGCSGISGMLKGVPQASRSSVQRSPPHCM